MQYRLLLRRFEQFNRVAVWILKLDLSAVRTDFQFIAEMQS